MMSYSPHSRVGWGTDGTLQGLVHEGVGTPQTQLLAGFNEWCRFPSPTSGLLGPSWGFLRWANANGPDRLSEINGQKVA